ncbi:MAG: DMT family transporter [Methanomassiliicoccus sp.]|nr:DMT family transporter [Methanomassiliicoccus sp.]
MRGEGLGGGEGDGERYALLLSLAAALLFGSQYVVIKDGMGGASPFLFGALTMGIGGILALLIARRRGRIDPSIFRHWEVWAGMLSTTCLIAFQYVGLTLSPASIGGLIVGSNVIFVAPLSALIFGEIISRRQVLGVMVGLLGLFTLTTNWDLSTLSSSVFVGDLLLLGASFSIASSYPLTKLAVRHMNNVEWVMSFHLLSVLPLVALMVISGGPGDPTSMSVPAVLYVGLLCTSVPTILWATGLRSLSMTTSATVLLSESAFAVLLGALVMNEPLGPVTLVGAGMVFTAIFLVVRTNGPKKDRE